MGLFINIILFGFWVGAIIYLIIRTFDLLTESKKDGERRKR